MKYLYPLNAIHITGVVILLYTKNDINNFVRDHGVWNDKHVVYFYDWRIHSYKEIHYNWIVRDDRGKIVKYDDFHENNYGKWLRERNAKIRKYMEKGLPIPRTGCSKAGYKQNHPAKKNSGYHHFAKNATKYSYDIKEHELKNKSRGSKWKHLDPWW